MGNFLEIFNAGSIFKRWSIFSGIFTLFNFFYPEKKEKVLYYYCLNNFIGHWSEIVRVKTIKLEFIVQLRKFVWYWKEFFLIYRGSWINLLFSYLRKLSFWPFAFVFWSTKVHQDKDRISVKEETFRVSKVSKDIQIGLFWEHLSCMVITSKWNH